MIIQILTSRLNQCVVNLAIPYLKDYVAPQRKQAMEGVCGI